MVKLAVGWYPATPLHRVTTQRLELQSYGFIFELINIKRPHCSSVVNFLTKNLEKKSERRRTEDKEL
jgi:hypothetical protein